MRLHIFTLLLPVVVLCNDQEPITLTRTMTLTVTETVTVHITPSGAPPLRTNGTLPYVEVHVTASAPIPAPSQIYVNKNNTNVVDSPSVVDSPNPAPKPTTPILSGNAAKYLINKKYILAVAGIITAVTAW
ncbi:hypothetical protein GcM1_247136 [Golovinomyces cichoracearum]|uniref:Uncharacterized protein n=1 Tax=Golovinomyces cichoracearum TaxID=62708 RepID=A0A420IDR0_9PEZI|nr:hypothetical protein GcM1_247136 [Golovinomyces cichoracearum]